MGYIQEDQILFYEELCAKSYDEQDITIKACIRFRENIRLANSIISKIGEPYDASIDRDDIIQTGYLGLWKACQNFDEELGFAFSTYATPMIRGEILRMLRDNNALHYSREHIDIRSTLYSHGFSLPLTEEEVNILVEEGKYSRAQILKYFEPTILSVDAPVNEDNESMLANIIPGELGIPTMNQLSEIEIESAIDSVLTYIKPSNRDIVEEWMYAVLEGEKISQITLSMKYNKSQSQIGRILRSAVDILKMNKDSINSLFGI